MAGEKVYDGHTVLFGMDSDTEPSQLGITLTHKAVNRRFRGGRNKTRPAFRQMVMHFNNPEDKELFRFGNVQGAAEYLKCRPGRKDGIVVSIAGVIFFISLVNENAYVFRVFTGNSPRLMHAFFCQAEEWCYIQDGEKHPIFWNGLTTDSARRSLGQEKGEMPIGTIMEYAHGRVFVSNEYNQIAASDIMFGSGFTNTKNVQNFTENKYWSEGGYFLLPMRYGPISGMIVMPRMNENLRGQGELVVMATRGAMSFDVSQPRDSWKDLQIQKISMTGRGCEAPYSLIDVNGDAWFRSDDGWSSYTNTRIDLQQKTAFRKFSREVNGWLDQDTDHLIRFASHIYFDNRILGTVSPFLSLPRSEKHGSHRYFRGILALDLDHASGVSGGESMNFDGLWTGVRPTALVKVNSRAFAFSFDTDGENRLYEITKQDGNDNGKKKIESFYITKRYAYRPSQSSEFQTKRLHGGVLWASGIRDRIAASIQYRSDAAPCWKEFMQETHYGSDSPSSPDGLPFTKPLFKKWKIGTPDDTCREASEELANQGAQHQFLIELEGNVQIDRFRVSANVVTDDELQGDCASGDTDDHSDEAITCPSESDFRYTIV